MNRKLLASAVLAAFGLTANFVAAQDGSQSASTAATAGGTVQSGTGDAVTTGVGPSGSDQAQGSADGAQHDASQAQGAAGGTNATGNTGNTAPVESQVGADPQAAKSKNDPNAKERADVVDAPTPELDAHGRGARGMRGDDESRERAGLPAYEGPVQRSDPRADYGRDDWDARSARMDRSMREQEWRAYQRWRNQARNDRDWSNAYREDRSGSYRSGAQRYPDEQPYGRGDYYDERAGGWDDRGSSQWRYRGDLDAGPSYSSPRYRYRDDWRSDRGWNSADAWADYYQGADERSDAGRWPAGDRWPPGRRGNAYPDERFGARDDWRGGDQWRWHDRRDDWARNPRGAEGLSEREMSGRRW